MKQKVLLIGASIEIATIAAGSNIEIVGTVEQNPNVDAGTQIVGDDDFVLTNAERFREFEIVVTVDDCKIRNAIYQRYKSAGFRFGSLLFGHVSPLARIGEGCIVMPGARISDRSILEPNCRLNFDALVGHDNRIGQSSIIAPRAVTLGFVEIGNRTYIGCNSTICPRVTVGDDVLVSAGSTVAAHLRDSLQVIGYYPLPKMHITIPSSRA